MAGRNIIIYSDGTGQRGGILVDENRSNIYKLYRATRCGPDSAVNPAEQLAFYDPGIGTLPANGGFFGKTYRGIYNLVSQALGMGLTGNMIDCYAAIIRMWRPGDRIFLFGFSRGAYTVRCLGAVIGLCGVPTQMKDGTPLRVDDATSKKIASEAVKTVYQHTSSWKKDSLTTRQSEMLDQRTELAKQFRRAYASGTDEKANVYPHFIGVFDTVASLANFQAVVAFIAIGAVLTGTLSMSVWFLLGPWWIFTAWWHYILAIVGIPALLGLAVNLWKRIKWERGLPHAKWYRPLHFAEWRMKFYDQTLNPNVGYARHAISIDEERDSFRREPWGDSQVQRDTGVNEHGEKNPPWLVQLWFAGNHSDIGGSYSEDRSRLSDISLSWMLDAARAVGLRYDPSLLRLYPDPSGPQHDETRSSIFRYARHSPRPMGTDFPLHDSVIERIKAGKVLKYDRYEDYRPDNLRDHQAVKFLYRQNS